MTGRLSDNKFETPVIIGNESSSENASVTAVGEQSESPMEVKLIPENYGEEEEAYGFSYLRQDTYKTFPKKTTNGRDSPPIKKFKGKLWPQVYASFAANMGSMALGTVVAWTATALPDMRKSEAWKTLDPSQESWIGSIMTLGAAVSCPVAGFGIERFGRRMSMLLLTLPFLAGWSAIYFAQNIPMIYTGRFLTGFCGGAFSIAVPVFITETADVKIRGALGSGFELLLTIGILYILLIGTFVPWDVQALACGVLPIIFHGLMLFAPESPRFLVERGKEPEASKALKWLRGAGTVDEVGPELLELKKSVADSRARKGTWRDLFSMSVIKPTSIGLALMFFQQMSGIDAITLYTVDIFKSAGSDIDEHLSASIFGVAQVVATLIAALVVDRCGRRLLLLISSFFMALSLGMMGLYFYLKLQNGGVPPENLSWLPLSSLTVYILSFSTGLGPIPWLMLAELIPSQVKGLAAGSVIISRWLLGFIVTLEFHSLMGILGEHGGFWFFASFCFIGTIYIYLFVPETKGKSLDEIQRDFQSPRAP